MCGITTIVVTFILEAQIELGDNDDLRDIDAILKKVFLILPQYCIGRGINDLAKEYNINQIISKFGNGASKKVQKSITF